MARYCTKSAPLSRAAHAAGALLPAACLLCACMLAAFPAAASAGAGDGEPAEPYGAGPQITEDGRLFAWLYLPGLPGRPELETLHVERAWADEPDVWEALYTFVWDEGWQEFAALEDPAQTVRYYNYDTGEDTPFADYFEAESSGRSFLLRARADIVVDGARETRSFAPVLFAVPGDEQPGEKPSADAGEGGGSGGDKGGIGQGEHERPVIEAPGLSASEASEAGGESAQAPPGEGGESASAGFSAPSGGSQPDGTEAAEPGSAPDPAEARDGASSPAADDRASEEGEAPNAQADDPPRIPGAVAALAATAVLAGTAAFVLRARTRRG